MASWKNVECERICGGTYFHALFSPNSLSFASSCAILLASSEIPSGLTSRFMKVYNLGCELDHRFEGWFSSEEDFISQSEAMGIECPICGSRAIKRLPAAPRLNLSSPSDPQNDAAAAIQAQVLSVVRKMVANTEDVGDRFAEEARRIHYKEVPERGIRGTATAKECEALSDEGIDVLRLPAAALKDSLH